MKNKTKIFITISAVLIIVLVFSAIKLVSMFNEYNNARERYDKLTVDYVEENESNVSSAVEEYNQNNSSESEESAEPIEKSPIEVDFAAISGISDDVEAWLYCPDSVINYPVVHGDNNEKYLYGYINGDYSISGSLFIDFRCADNFNGPLTVIYGHNMKDGSMLASICRFKKQDYYDAHPFMYINTADGNYRVRLFSAFTANADSDIYTFSFQNDDDFTSYLLNVKSKSDFICDSVPDSSDRIVMFSTCTYDYDSARYVLFGILESIS